MAHAMAMTRRGGMSHHHLSAAARLLVSVLVALVVPTGHLALGTAVRGPVSSQVRAYAQCCEQVTAEDAPVVLFAGLYNATQLAGRGLEGGAGCVRVFTSVSPAPAAEPAHPALRMASVAAHDHALVALLYSGAEPDGFGVVVTADWNRCSPDNMLRAPALALRIARRGAVPDVKDFGQVTVYSQREFLGIATQLRIGGHDSLSQPRLYDVMSIDVPDELVVYLYRQREYKDLAWVLTRSEGNLDLLRMARRVKSVAVVPRDHALSYSACNFRGNPLVLSPGLHVEGFKGRYPSAKAILTPPGLTVDLHRSLTLGPLAASLSAPDPCIGGLLGSSVRFMSAHVDLRPLPVCPNATAPPEREEAPAPCNIDVTVTSAVLFPVKVLKVARKNRMEEDATEIASLFPQTSTTVAGLCVGHVVRAVSAGGSVTRILLNHELVEATGRARHMPQHRRDLHLVVSDCKSASADRPVELKQTFAAGEFSVRLGRPGPHKSQGGPTRYSVSVDLGRLFGPIKQRVNVDRQVLCPLCKGSGATHASKLHTCHTCNGTGRIEHSHALCTGGTDGSGGGHDTACLSQTRSNTCPACAGHGKTVQFGEECPRCHGARTIRTKQAVEMAFAAGAEDGTTCSFPDMGNEDPFTQAGEVVFAVATRNHGGFTREGQNIVSILNLTLAEALGGINTTLVHLNGTKVPLVVPGIIAPDTNATIRGAGLPFNDEEENVRCGAAPKPPPPPTEPLPRGDWVIVLNIVFPERRRLNRTERVRLGSAFGRRRSRRGRHAQGREACEQGDADCPDAPAGANQGDRDEGSDEGTVPLFDFDPATESEL